MLRAVRAIAFCKKEVQNLNCGVFFTLRLGSIFVHLLSFMHCLVIVNRAAGVCAPRCARRFLQGQGLTSQQLLSLEKVGKVCFTEMAGNGVSSTLSISLSRYLTSNRKEDYQKYCKTELYPVQDRVYCGYNVM